ncbi:hypothetical protein CV_2414 [Chromobacterium violaceum ATCC 12472]|uniref:Uncharacterized protein n=1 Tax=Chromobacterium violaceum (strain ATCC 12472 / DSM 30191 / JCM 1249 / CCUG 213 / NBRC 12614 / NCIMB 9131 / NCTC 9757 / MK) TaxID=243365 RepID=Q7NVC9_CHRVO|nr:hypothetical protein CV_2414 [Chromobacterium violaceum ATCC 12472]
MRDDAIAASPGEAQGAALGAGIVGQRALAGAVQGQPGQRRQLGRLWRHAIHACNDAGEQAAEGIVGVQVDLHSPSALEEGGDQSVAGCKAAIVEAVQSQPGAAARAALHGQPGLAAAAGVAERGDGRAVPAGAGGVALVNLGGLHGVAHAVGAGADVKRNRAVIAGLRIADANPQRALRIGVDVYFIRRRLAQQFPCRCAVAQHHRHFRAFLHGAAVDDVKADRADFVAAGEVAIAQSGVGDAAAEQVALRQEAADHRSEIAGIEGLLVDAERELRIQHTGIVVQHGGAGAGAAAAGGAIQCGEDLADAGQIQAQPVEQGAVAQAAGLAAAIVHVEVAAAKTAFQLHEGMPVIGPGIGGDGVQHLVHAGAVGAEGRGGEVGAAAEAGCGQHLR